jgi:hypothetical protein
MIVVMDNLNAVQPGESASLSARGSLTQAVPTPPPPPELLGARAHRQDVPRLGRGGSFRQRRSPT